MFQPFFNKSKTYLNKNQFSSAISYILLFLTWMSLELYRRDRNSDIWLSDQFRRDSHIATHTHLKVRILQYELQALCHN